MMIMLVVSTCTVKYGYILGTQAHFRYFRYIFGTVGILRVHQVHFRYCRYIQGTPGTFWRPRHILGISGIF